MRKVFLDNLPRKGSLINWKESINHEIEGINDNIKFKFKIIDYERNKKGYITIKYKDKEFDIQPSSLKRNISSKLMGRKPQKNSWRYKKKQTIIKYDDYGNIKTHLIIVDTKLKKEKVKNKNDKRGFTIQNKKYYKFKCLLCGFNSGKHYRKGEYKKEFWIEENSLIKYGCSCCSSQIVVEDINSIYKKHPWMIPFISEECAKTHTHGSRDRVQATCPDCGRLKIIDINDLHNTKSISCICSDNISYPEKTIYSVIEQLNLNFQTQLNKTTFKWCDKYKYDFYFELDNEKYIIETHGEQHYCRSFERIKGAKTLEQEIENDKIKRELAISNGIKEENYIVIDCRKSQLEWIKDNKDGILKSILNELFDLSKIDWFKVEEFALSSRVKEACELWNNDIQSTREIGNMMKLSQATIITYLKKGSNKLNWCEYNPKDEQIKSAIRNGRKNNKRLIVVKNNKFYGIYYSLSELGRECFNDFGVKMTTSLISQVCNDKQKQHKGYQFKYIEDLTLEEYIKYDIENKLKKLHNKKLVQAC
jgi:predicted transcriptional regulator